MTEVLAKPVTAAYRCRLMVHTWHGLHLRDVASPSWVFAVRVRERVTRVSPIAVDPTD